MVKPVFGDNRLIFLMNSFKVLYKRVVLDHPYFVVGCMVPVTLFFVAFIPHFRLDASSDSLLLEGDQSFKYYSTIRERYGSDDYVVVTYTPKRDLFDNITLANLSGLRDRLKELKRVKTVTTILDVPLVNSPPVTIDEFRKNQQTLTSPGTDKALARRELVTSPLYSELLISKDAKTTAVLVGFQQDEEWFALSKKRDRLREKELKDGLSGEEDRQLNAIEAEYAERSKENQREQKEDIAAIRKITQDYRDTADIHLGGVKMIAVDSIEYVRSDLKVFGLAVLCFIIVLLTLFFRKARWVLLPILNCLTVGVMMFGFLGLVGWPVTVVSSNFISLLLIFTMSFSIHQIVHYHEYQADHPQADQHTLVSESTLQIIVPCLFMVVTTIVAFGSLVVSDIRPVIDFGWLMAVGLGVSFLLSFTLFPAVLMFLKPVKPAPHADITGKVTRFFAHAIERHGKPILTVFLIVIVAVGAGILFLTVENRFIDYYKESTEIHQGMKLIDQKLGGTVPLDVIVDAPPDFLASYRKKKEAFIEKRKKEDPSFVYSPSIVDGYWITWPRADMTAIHKYLEGLSETGKVLSFQTTMAMAHDLDPQAANTILLGFMKEKLPKDVRDMLFNSYISPDGNQLRFNARIYETDKTLKRDKLIKDIGRHLTNEIGLADDRVYLTGMLVLYNNVLQSLFDSQIKTIWTVFITIFVMFTILFRSPWVAGVAFLPNITITVLVLGIMGWLRIPLDIMTITIAAICTGSADDNTIHYVHRFKTELGKHGDYWKAVHASHDSIGRAMYYASVTIILGFSLLAFSNFVPTIYFGLLVALALLLALLANLVLLPLLIVLFKPLGKPH